jgi:hypothetical protein
MVPRYKGIGTFGIIIKSITPTVSVNLTDEVFVNVDRVMGYGAVSYIRGPRETGTTFKFNVYYDRQLPDDELTDIESTMSTAIEDYVNGLDIGETLYLDRMVSTLFTVSSHITNIGSTDKRIEEAYVYKTTRLADNKIRQSLIGDYYPATDERIIIEPSITDPVQFNRYFDRR